jgi:hypothetical protein
MTKFLPGRGLDVGTSFIISSRQYEEDDNKVQYTEFRDAFLKLKPSSPIAKKMMAKGLKGQQYFEDVDGSYIVVGQDAIERSIERNVSANRPLDRGVISPHEKQARRILRHIFKEILGKPAIPGEKVVYSVPAQPIDQSADQFDVGWHTDAINNDLRALGFNPSPLSEAEAICYSELEGDDYTGVCLSFGAGMVNACLMSSGEGILHWSTTRSGDWIDRMAALATAQPDTVVQVEKEHSSFMIGQEIPSNPILSAVSSYYVRLIDYTVQHLLHRLLKAEHLPKFSEPLPIILAGGTSQAKGFVEQFQKTLDENNKGDLELPFEIKEVRAAGSQLRAVSRGCLLASQL